MRRRVIIDTGPRQDDAIAILLALASSDEPDVRGIVAVAWNVPLNLAERNARKISAGCPTAPISRVSRPLGRRGGRAHYRGARPPVPRSRYRGGAEPRPLGRLAMVGIQRRMPVLDQVALFIQTCLLSARGAVRRDTTRPDPSGFVPPFMSWDSGLEVFCLPEIDRDKVAIRQLLEKGIVARDGLDAFCGDIRQEPVAVGLARLPD